MSLASELPTLRARINDSCNRALERSTAVATHIRPAQELTTNAYQAIASGKRFRAIGAYIGAAVTTDTTLGAHDLDDLAAALELYQASALAHDDVIDHADTRRGSPTPHRIFEHLHTERAWLSNPQEFGQASAILLGDLLFSAAEASIHRFCSTIPTHYANSVYERYATMHTEVAIGQYLDVRAEQLPLDPADNNALDEHTITEVVRLKSARYSVVHPVLLGAQTVGATPDLRHALEAIVHPWGMAFQYRDDVLGVFGNPEVTGKPAGDDLIEGKRTLLLALTWQHGDATQRRHIAHLFNAPPHARHEYVGDLRDIISQSGLRHMENTITDLVAQGTNALEHAVTTGLISDQSAGILSELGDILTKRSA